LQVGNTKRIVELLKGGNIDIGLVEGEVPKQKITSEKLLEDELVLIVPPQHPFAKKKEVSIFEITTEPFIVREEGSGTRQMIEKYLEKHGINLNNMNITMILGSTEAIKNAVEHGMGISIISRWAALKEERFGTFKTLSFKEEKFLREFTLIYQKYEVLSHASEEFLSFLKTYDFSKLLEGRKKD
ncbi:MAG: LysR family transcriptional regulator, partial [Nitrospirae bacterium]